VTIQEPMQVTSCCNLQRVFIAEHYLASRSYLTCQNEFWGYISRLSCTKQIDNISSGEPFSVTAETLRRVASDMREKE
jgi:hypothetical protein